LCGENTQAIGGTFARIWFFASHKAESSSGAQLRIYALI
jgi:hypothetical protein